MADTLSRGYLNGNKWYLSHTSSGPFFNSPQHQNMDLLFQVFPSRGLGNQSLVYAVGQFFHICLSTVLLAQQYSKSSGTPGWTR